MPTSRSISKNNPELNKSGETDSTILSTKGALREKAEELLDSKQPVPLSVRVKRTHEPINLPDADTQKLIYELEVHQIELEMQNKELQLAKEQLEIAAKKYAELYDFSPAGYFTLSREGDILDLNLYGSRLLEKNRNILLNSKFGFFVSHESKPDFNNFLDSLFTFKSKLTCEITLCREKGSQPIYVHLSGVITDDKEKCLIAAVNITERKLAEEEIKSKNAELQRVNAEKDKFFSIISHDLRGPFNGFLGLTELMSEGDSEMTLEEIQKTALIMRNSARNLHYLLGNLLEWSRLQREMISFLPKTHLLKTPILESLNSLSGSANEKSIEINTDIPDNLTVYADKYMLETVVRNLVSNAIKFTPHGGKVSVWAKMLPDNGVELSIQDTGIGMDKDLLENLFKLAVRTGRKGTDGELTTGLGLIICKDLIEKHNGKLWTESQVGKGSIFHLTFPAQH